MNPVHRLKPAPQIGSFGGVQIIGFVVITARIRLVPHFSIWLDLPSLKRRQVRRLTAILTKIAGRA
jgi:hypothetical protein